MEEEIVVEKLKSTQPEIVLLTEAVQVEYPSCAIYKKSKNLLNCVLNSYSFLILIRFLCKSLLENQDFCFEAHHLFYMVKGYVINKKPSKQ